MDAEITYKSKDGEFQTTQPLTWDQLTAIKVKTKPSKLNYAAEEALDTTGMAVDGTYSVTGTDDVTSACTTDPANGTALKNEIGDEMGLDELSSDTDSAFDQMLDGLTDEDLKNALSNNDEFKNLVDGYDYVGFDAQDTTSTDDFVTDEIPEIGSDGNRTYTIKENKYTTWRKENGEYVSVTYHYDPIDIAVGSSHLAMFPLESTLNGDTDQRYFIIAEGQYTGDYSYTAQKFKYHRYITYEDGSVKEVNVSASVFEVLEYISLVTNIPVFDNYVEAQEYLMSFEGTTESTDYKYKLSVRTTATSPEPLIQCLADNNVAESVNTTYGLYPFGQAGGSYSGHFTLQSKYPIFVNKVDYAYYYTGEGYKKVAADGLEVAYMVKTDDKTYLDVIEDISVSGNYYNYETDDNGDFQKVERPFACSFHKTRSADDTSSYVIACKAESITYGNDTFEAQTISDGVIGDSHYSYKSYEGGSTWEILDPTIEGDVKDGPGGAVVRINVPYFNQVLSSYSPSLYLRVLLFFPFVNLQGNYSVRDDIGQRDTKETYAVEYDNNPHYDSYADWKKAITGETTAEEPSSSNLARSTKFQAVKNITKYMDADGNEKTYSDGDKIPVQYDDATGRYFLNVYGDTLTGYVDDDGNVIQTNGPSAQWTKIYVSGGDYTDANGNTHVTSTNLANVAITVTDAADPDGTYTDEFEVRVTPTKAASASSDSSSSSDSSTTTS